jgi:hypothetical protein
VLPKHHVFAVVVRVWRIRPHSVDRVPCHGAD